MTTSPELPPQQELAWYGEIIDGLQRSQVAVNAPLHWHSEDGLGSYHAVPTGTFGEIVKVPYGELDSALPADLARLSSSWRLSVSHKDPATRSHRFSHLILNRSGGIAASLELPLSSQRLTESAKTSIENEIRKKLQDGEPLEIKDYELVTEALLSLDTVAKTAVVFWGIVRAGSLDEKALQASAEWAAENKIF